MIDITQIAAALIGLLAAVITTVVVPWIKAKVGANRWEQLEAVVRVAVRAAEQMGAIKAVDDKLAYAMERAAQALEAMGVMFDADTLRAAVEAEVLALKKA